MTRTSCGAFKGCQAKINRRGAKAQIRRETRKSREFVILSAAKDLTAVRFFTLFRMTHSQLFLVSLLLFAFSASFAVNQTRHIEYSIFSPNPQKPCCKPPSICRETHPFSHRRFCAMRLHHAISKCGEHLREMESCIENRARNF